MPWITSSLLEARQRLVQAALRGDLSMAHLCRQAKVSRKTGFKWLKRFRHQGRAGLHNQSRRPQHSPLRTPKRWREAIRQLRQQHPTWGAKKMHARLQRKHPRAILPSHRTIQHWIGRWGLARRRRTWAKRGPRIPPRPLTIPQAPTEVWTGDFKGGFRTRNGQRVDPLTVRDLFSRYVLGIRLLRFRHEPVQQYFQQIFKQYCQPKVIRTDHGSPFAGDGALALSRLSAWWLRLGIRVEFTGKARPQDNGAHEQLHRVYKAETASPPAATPRGQQWRSTRWLKYYNEQRPHEALGQRMPVQFYRQSPHRYRPPRAELKYPPDWPTQ